MDTALLKAQARDAVRQRLARLTAQDRDAESRSICRRILENLPAAPLHICIYSALPSEASLAMLLPALWERDDTVYAPRFSGGKLTFGQIYEDTTLLKGALGILEPPVDSPAPSLEGIDIVLVPGMAFDKNGNRLGRGNGGYDQWLFPLRQVNDTVRVWGVALDCQMLREVPSEPHDQRMDAVATPRELWVLHR